MTGTSKRLAEESGPELKRQLVTLQTLLTESAKQYPDKIALICPHQPADYLGQQSVSETSEDSPPYLRWTYSQLFDAATTFAARLHSHGIRRGMRIAAFLRNGAQWAIGLWAAAREYPRQVMEISLTSLNSTGVSIRHDQCKLCE